MSNILLSVILPARTEFPNIVHTCHNILSIYEADGFDPKTIQLIIVDNCSTDNDNWPQRGVKGTTTYLMPRGIYWSGMLKVIYDPIAGNHSARNKGVQIAQGKYLFFSDSHMSYKPGFFKYGLQTLEETQGLVHGVIAWMGAYPTKQNDGKAHGLGHQYSLKLGEEIKGTWAPYAPSTTDWFYIAAQGHCSLFAIKDQFIKFGGYPKVHRTYGGGEFYIDTKWWMFGSQVVVDPRCIGYHLASSRGYTYHHDDYIENVLGMAYSLGMDDWRERAYINWLRHGRKEVLEAIDARNKKEYQSEREFIDKRKKKTFNQVILEKPWDKLNDKKFGKHISGFTIFHDSWLELLKQAPDYVKDAYRNSKYQKELEKFINENLSESVYKRKEPIWSFDETGKCLI